MTQTGPTFTLVVTVFNLGEYLTACLRSITQQTFKDLEVLAVDDHSTDGSGRVLDEWAKQDDRYHVMHLPTHGGVSVARNWGIDHAHGQFISFIDGDDVLEPAYVATVVLGFNTDLVDMGIVGSDWHGRSQGGTQWQSLTRDEMLEEATRHGTQIGGYTWNKGFRLAQIKVHQLRFDESLKLAEDLLFTAQYDAQASHFRFNPTVLYHKINRPDSIIHTASRQMRAGEWQVNQRIEKMRKQN